MRKEWVVCGVDTTVPALPEGNATEGPRCLQPRTETLLLRHLF